MKKFKPVPILIAAIIAISAIFAVMPVMAGSENNVGRHVYKINIIGRPNDWSGKDTGSSSKTLFISLFEQKERVVCEPTSGVVMKHVYVETPLPGQRIYFYTNTANEFDVEDRDATDGKAIVSIPETTGGYDIYVRVLGGSNKNFPGCLDADAYKFISADNYYYIGHLDANRNPGKPEKVNVRSLFYDNGVSYFDTVWSDYFWVIANNGLRNMQLIFYETT